MLFVHGPDRGSVVITRDYGVGEAVLHDDTYVTVISQPTWGTCIAAYRELDDPGRFVLTPELITLAGLDPSSGSLTEAQLLVEQRIAEVTRLSLQYPDSTLVLGTPLYYPELSKPRNAVLLVSRGVERQRIHKQVAISRFEREAFYQPGHREDMLLPEPGVLPLICSDMFGDHTDPNVHTILVSACWATPVMPDGAGASKDKDLEKFLGETVRRLYLRYPALMTVVMADRSFLASQTARPYNLWAR